MAWEISGAGALKVVVCVSGNLPSPSAKLSNHCDKSWVIFAVKLGHIHVVSLYAYRGISWQNRRMRWNDLTQIRTANGTRAEIFSTY